MDRKVKLFLCNLWVLNWSLLGGNVKTIVIIYLALVVLAMTACPKAPNSTATVPEMRADCVNNPSACNPAIYQQNPGFSNYNQNYQYSNNLSNLCHCPYGTTPTYNNYAGLGCVQSSQIQGYGHAYFTWGSGNISAHAQGSYGSRGTYGSVYGSVYASAYAGYGAQGYGSQGYGAQANYGAANTQWTNTPQISNVGGGYADTCFNGVVQSCVVGQSNTCGVGYTCRVAAASSRLGLCVQNNANRFSGQTYR